MISGSFSNLFGVVTSVGRDHFMRFRYETSVFEFLRLSVDGGYMKPKAFIQAYTRREIICTAPS